jgi:hypothetical protein
MLAALRAGRRFTPQKHSFLLLLGTEIIYVKENVFLIEEGSCRRMTELSVVSRPTFSVVENKFT